MSFGSIIFTDKGRILQAKAQTGKQLNFTKIQIGDGELGGRSIQELTALISAKKNITISTLKTSNGEATIGGVLNNSDITTGFYWREVGLFAIDPDTSVETLYCYGNAGALAEYIPAGGGSEILEKRLDIVAIVGNAANVSATISESLVYATPEDIENHNEDTNAHEDIRNKISDCLEKIGPLTGLMTSVKTSIVAAINSLCTLASTTVNGLMSKEDKTKLNGIQDGATKYVHPGSGTNPHGTTKADVGLGSVLNYGIATTVEAQVAISNEKYMTPALVKVLLQYQVQNGGVSMIKSVQRGQIISAFDGDVTISPVNINKSFIVLSNYGASSSAGSALCYLVPPSSGVTTTTMKAKVDAVASRELYWQIVEFY